MTHQVFFEFRGLTAVLVAGAILLPGPVLAESGPPEVGTAVLSVNRVQQVSQGRAVPLPKGARVLFESLVRTGADSANKDVLEDGSELVLGPGAEVRIDRFIYDPASGTGEAEVNLLAGAMRWASGSMAPSSYTIKTPSAILGIRGTGLVAAVTAAGESVIVLESGAVRVTGTSRRSVTLAPNQYTVVDTRGVPSPARDVVGSPAAPIIAALNTALATLTPPAETLAPSRFDDLSDNADVVRVEARQIPATAAPEHFGGDGSATHADLSGLGIEDHDGVDDGGADNDNGGGGNEGGGNEGGGNEGGGENGGW